MQSTVSNALIVGVGVSPGPSHDSTSAQEMRFMHTGLRILGCHPLFMLMLHSRVAFMQLSTVERYEIT
jgi:hypothetical protein